MKGLILKDFYTLMKHCKIVIIMCVLFELFGIFGDDNNYFFISYPCVFGCVLPVSLLNYDERERWNKYVQTLPVSKAQYVSGKYIVGLILTILFIILSSILQIIKVINSNTIGFSEYTYTMISIISFSLILSAFIMPFIFKLGAEKGRLYYLFGIGIFCALFVMSAMGEINLFLDAIPMIAILSICILLYIFSWILSIQFYTKREIK